MAEDRARRLCLGIEPEGEVGLDETVKCLRRVARGLEILHHHTEPANGCRVVAAAQVVAPNLHLLAREMIEGEVELGDRGAGVLAFGDSVR